MFWQKYQDQKKLRRLARLLTCLNLPNDVRERVEWVRVEVEGGYRHYLYEDGAYRLPLGMIFNDDYRKYPMSTIDGALAYVTAAVDLLGFAAYHKHTGAGLTVRLPAERRAA